MVAQGLGNGCPRLGQRLPKAWATVAQGLGTGCPRLGQRFPNTWETVVENLGNGFPINPCETGPSFNAWGRQSQSWGVHHFRPGRLGFSSHRCSGGECLGPAGPHTVLPNCLQPVRPSRLIGSCTSVVAATVADQPSQSFKSDPGVITGFGIGSCPPVRRRSHGAQKSRGLYTLRRRDHEGYHDGAALSGLGLPPSSPREAVCETNM